MIRGDQQHNGAQFDHNYLFFSRNSMPLYLSLYNRSFSGDVAAREGDGGRGECDEQVRCAARQHVRPTGAHGRRCGE